VIEVVFRDDGAGSRYGDPPATAERAVERLCQGNARFAALELPAGPEAPGEAPRQKPFAIVLSCADARVPVEIVFSQSVNELFVVRVAGNVIGADCLGSIDLAVHNFRDSVRVVTVMGHTHCGAVAAAVEAFLEPPRYLALASSFPLRSIVDRILVAVRSAARTLETIHGRDAPDDPRYRERLAGLAVILNAAYTAYSLRQELAASQRHAVDVVYGLYDLATRRVTAPGASAGPGLVAPPENAEAFDALAAAAARNGAS
jgi:carbonic anhydrase